jgi:hypothetical protein
VFCRRSFDLGAVLPGVGVFRAKPVGTLGRTIEWKSRGPFGRGPFTFTRDSVRDALGIDPAKLATNYEVNAGLIFWNNAAAAEHTLFEAVTNVFAACDGCFEADQDLLAFTAAAHGIPFAELSEAYNFCGFADTSHFDTIGTNLRKQVRIGNLAHVCIVHFWNQKPWQRPDTWPHRPPPSIMTTFVNDWRRFVVSELGDTAFGLFDDLAVVRVRRPVKPFWNLLRRLRSGWGHW